MSLRSFIACAFAVIFFALVPSVGRSQVRLPSERIGSENFALSYDRRGVTGLFNPKNLHSAEFPAAGVRLGPPVVKYKVEGGDWLDILMSERKLDATSEQGSLVYTDFEKGSPLKMV